MVDDSSRVSRRALLAASGAAGAAAVLAGCTSIKPAANPALSKLALRPSRADVPVLNGLLEVEYLAAYAYTASVPVLDQADALTAVQFLHHELAHITVLHTLILNAGATPIQQRSEYPLGSQGGRSELLSMLRRIEGRALTAYLGAIPKLSPGGVRAIASSIMANEGQHISVLRSALGLKPVPAALASGSE